MKFLKGIVVAAVFIGSLVAGVMPVNAAVDYDYYYAVESEYSPMSFKQVVLDLPLPDELQNETISYKLTTGKSYYIYGGTEINTKINTVTYATPIKAGTNSGMKFSWSNFVDTSTSPAKVNYLGFRMVIDYLKPDNEIVTVMYDIKFINATLNVQYQDESGQTIAEPDIISGSVGDDYTVQPAEIDGYEFVRAEGDAESGQLGTAPKTVTYIYGTAPEPVMGNLVVRYVDEAGNDILSEQSFTEPAGTEYAVQPEVIDGWELVDTIGAASGQYVDGSIEVQFVYREVGQSAPNTVDNVVSSDVNNDVVLPVTGGTGFELFVFGGLLIFGAVFLVLQVRKKV